MTRPVPSEPRRRPWLTGFAAVNALAARAGGVGLVGGGLDFGETIDEGLRFDSLVIAEMALIVVVARADRRGRVLDGW